VYFFASKAIYTLSMNTFRHILITGASSGIGAALALEYAAPGIQLSLHGRDTQRLSAVAEQARQRGANLSIHTGDVTDAADMLGFITTCDATQPIDLVIANAGISAGTAQDSESADQVARIFATNVTGVFNTVHPALTLMKKRRQGQIAIVSSLAGFRGFPGAPAYCASKAAVRIYGEALRADMKKHNIAINVICPGFVKTPMTDANPFAMPFMITAARAALLIRHGLGANHGRIAFPRRLYALVLLLNSLPQLLIEILTARTPKK
jgi:NADP-dependent 3-hydroxy acid dehydrogenase YdfG